MCARTSPASMCARLELNETQVQPGNSVGVWLEDARAVWLAWSGVARRESLHRWLSMGGQLVDIPADRFASRSTRTGKLIWEDVPLGFVARGLIDSNGGKPLLKIVTRAATAEELQKFEHPRMPVIEPPRVSAERILPPHPAVERPLIVQPDLFVSPC
jgi:hypothetical protein